MFNLIIFGPPGAGKGTQAQKISEDFNLIHLSTGALLREEVSQQTTIGKQVQTIVAGGGLVDDNIVDTIVKNEIEKNGPSAGFVFDGYPRNINQALKLDTLLTTKALPLVLNLEVNQEELISRLKLRGQKLGRADDNKTTISNRLLIYAQQTQPLLDFYAEKERLISVDGQGSIEEVFEHLKEQILKRK
ncbi:MAG: adenylate kinase [Patescibacteria group bacterium]|nr:adenylate kinase [Patescibacteria group bacterium]